MVDDSSLLWAFWMAVFVLLLWIPDIPLFRRVGYLTLKSKRRESLSRKVVNFSPRWLIQSTMQLSAMLALGSPMTSTSISSSEIQLIIRIRILRVVDHRFGYKFASCSLWNPAEVDISMKASAAIKLLDLELTSWIWDTATNVCNGFTQSTNGENTTSINS